MEQQFPLKELQAQFKRVLDSAPRLLGADTVNFFLDRFKDQAWMGTTREPWKPRSTKTWVKDKRPGRQILIDRGRLRQSIRITSTTGDTAKIGTDVPYAKAHNEGFKGTVTQKVGSYSRRVQSGAKVIVRAHSRTIKQKIPKRQFMGYSPVLETQLKAKLKAQLLKGFEGLKF